MLDVLIVCDGGLKVYEDGDVVLIIIPLGYLTKRRDRLREVLAKYSGSKINVEVTECVKRQGWGVRKVKRVLREVM